MAKKRAILGLQGGEAEAGFPGDEKKQAPKRPSLDYTLIKTKSPTAVESNISKLNFSLKKESPGQSIKRTSADIPYEGISDKSRASISELAGIFVGILIPAGKSKQFEKYIDPLLRAGWAGRIS